MGENKTIAYYNQHAQEYYDKTVDIDMTSNYGEFLQYLDFGDHILDAGCGSGRDSQYFIEQGYEVTALDAAQELVDLAEGLLGQEVLQIRLEELDFTAEFDGIWACASLIHLKEDQIKEILRKFSRAVVTDGVIYISFKIGTGEEFKKGRFFNYYNELSCLELIAEIDPLKVVNLWETDDAEDREDVKWLNLVLRKGNT